MNANPSPQKADEVFVVEIANCTSPVLFGEGEGTFGEDTVTRFATEEEARAAAIGPFEIIDEERDVDGSLAIVVAYGQAPCLRTVVRANQSPAYARFMDI